MKTITFELNSDDENDNTSSNEKLNQSEIIEKYKKVLDEQRKIFKNFKTALDNISTFLMDGLYSNEYLENFDSIKGFLKSKGLISPKNKKEFFDWYFKQIAKRNPKLKLTDFDLYPKLERSDIIEFTQLLTMEAENELSKVKRKLIREKTINENKDQIPTNFEDIFLKPEMADNYLNVLNDIEPPLIDKTFNYIGNNKGFFPLWINILKRKEPPIIKYFHDIVYKNLLNQKINGLNLSKDASEFKKNYKRAEEKRREIEVLISQVSLEGK